MCISCLRLNAEYIAFIWLVSCSMVGGCRNNDPQIVIIVPDDYRGVVRIQHRVAEGDDPRVGRYKYVFEIPVNGEFKSSRGDMFKEWHYLEARYRNGSSIPVGDYEETKPTEIALRSVGDLPEKQESWFVIGSQADAEEAIAEFIQQQGQGGHLQENMREFFFEK